MLGLIVFIVGLVGQVDDGLRRLLLRLLIADHVAGGVRGLKVRC